MPGLKDCTYFNILVQQIYLYNLYKYNSEVENKFISPPSFKVTGNINAHKEHRDLPTVEGKPGHVGPSHLLPISDGQGEGGGTVLVGRQGGHCI